MARPCSRMRSCLIRNAEMGQSNASFASFSPDLTGRITTCSTQLLQTSASYKLQHILWFWNPDSRAMGPLTWLLESKILRWCLMHGVGTGRLRPSTSWQFGAYKFTWRPYILRSFSTSKLLYSLFKYTNDRTRYYSSDLIRDSYRTPSGSVLLSVWTDGLGLQEVQQLVLLESMLGRKSTLPWWGMEPSPLEPITPQTPYLAYRSCRSFSSGIEVVFVFAHRDASY